MGKITMDKITDCCINSNDPINKIEISDPYSKFWNKSAFMPYYTNSPYEISDHSVFSEDFMNEYCKSDNGVSLGEIRDCIDYVDDQIGVLEDDLQHYTMTEPDRAKKIFIIADLDNFKNIKKCLEELWNIKNYGSK
jgi:hypothetical protein